jgi:hypothetical protein
VSKVKTIYQANLTAILFLFSPFALAYVGPGAGLSAIGSVIAFIGAFLLIIVGFLWYPIKRLLFKSKQEKKSEDQNGPKAGSNENDE